MVDIPSGWDPRAKQQPARLIAYSANCVVALRVAFADFSAAPRQGFEKSERCPNSSSLFLPRPSGYENVANFEIPFFLWNLVTI